MGTKSLLIKSGDYFPSRLSAVIFFTGNRILQNWVADYYQTLPRKKPLKKFLSGMFPKPYFYLLDVFCSLSISYVPYYGIIL